MKKLFAVVILLSLVALIMVPMGVLAQQEIPETITTPDALVTLIETITNWVFTVFLLLAVLFLIIGAMQFVTAGGKPESVSEARQKIIWAVVGIVIALLARSIPAVLTNIVGT